MKEQKKKIFNNFTFYRESRIKGLGDALGVDWSSLIKESKALMREKLSKKETSAKQRWNPNQILLDIGVSYKMAGGTFAQKTLLNAFEELKTEAENIPTIKTEANDENHMDIDIKTENVHFDDNLKEEKINGKCDIDETSIVQPKLHLHPLPCVQRAAQNLCEKQNRLIFNATGPYSRGLCTKRDIAMRRQLCNLAVNETNCKTNNTKNCSGYENIALKLFQKSLQT